MYPTTTMIFLVCLLTNQSELSYYILRLCRRELSTWNTVVNYSFEFCSKSQESVMTKCFGICYWTLKTFEAEWV